MDIDTAVFTAIVAALYLTIGFGVHKLLNNSSYGNGNESFIAILFWPVILFIISFLQ